MHHPKPKNMPLNLKDGNKAIEEIRCNLLVKAISGSVKTQVYFDFGSSKIGGAIRNADFQIDTLGITVNVDGKNKAVLLYDTEQSETQLYKNISNILRRSCQDKTPNTSMPTDT